LINSTKHPSLNMAARMSMIEPFHVMEIQARAQAIEASGRSVIHMEIGQPDFGAPPQVVEAATRAMQESPLGYTGALGIAPLRSAIASYLDGLYGTAVDPDRIAVTPGASGAFLLLLGILVGPGDEVLMPDPCYPCNRHFVRMLDAQPVLMPVGADTGYQPTLAHVRDAWTEKTRGIVLASPSNPTGTLLPQDELRAIADWVCEQGGFVIVDEIYDGLVYGAERTAALQLPHENLFVINSFSKYFCMTGWRLGWAVSPSATMRQIEKLAQNLFICPPAVSQHAAMAAFLPDTIELLESRRMEFQRRRDFLVSALQGLGLRVNCMPGGAFYVWADCSAFGSSDEFVTRSLESAGVAATPGLDFGPHGARQHVRFAYTRSMTELQEGIARLGKLWA
jgi:aspartate/methionine/tyrosine aminotransferase